MPPKRRKAQEADANPQPTKRTTRSSAKTQSAATPPSAPKQKAEPKPPLKTRKSKTTETTTSTTPASQSKSTKLKSKPPATSPSTSQTPSTTSTLTITSPLTKTPLQCHTYTPRSSPSRSTNTLIFTHGAGGTLSAPAVVHFCTGYSAQHPILAFQGSMNLASRVKGFHACLARARSSAPHETGSGDGVVLGGRSMGARAAVMAASEILTDGKKGQGKGGAETGRVQLVLVSYPLKGPKGDLRDQILLDLAKGVEVLFVIGERDAMCPLDVLEGVRTKMKATSQLVVARGADHGMHVKPATAEREVGVETGRVAAEWVRGGLERGVVYVGEEEG